MKNYLFILMFIAMSSSYLHSSSPIFYIEGSTGAGKTTLIRALAEKNPDFVVLEEPVAAVQNVNGINALQLMYEDQARWSLNVYLLYYVYHMHNMQNALSKYPNSTIVSDRSIFTGYPFCYADSISGHLHPLENSLYQELSKLSASNIPKPHGFIYLRTSPEVSFERICKRQRKEEADVDIQYWKNIHEGHEKMLVHKTVGPLADVPVLVIEADCDMHQNSSFIPDSIRTIEQFMQQCIREHKN